MPRYVSGGLSVFLLSGAAINPVPVTAKAIAVICAA